MFIKNGKSAVISNINLDSKDGVPVEKTIAAPSEIASTDSAVCESTKKE